MLIESSMEHRRMRRAFSRFFSEFYDTRIAGRVFDAYGDVNDPTEAVCAIMEQLEADGVFVLEADYGETGKVWESTDGAYKIDFGISEDGQIALEKIDVDKNVGYVTILREADSTAWATREEQFLCIAQDRGVIVA